MSNQRKHQRTPLKVKFRIWHDSFGEAVVMTRDVSEGGVFLITEKTDVEIPPTGTVMQGQVQDVMDDPPIVTMEVVRIEPMGIGLRFVE
ncbi:MAG: PilZ domain-containing protein [Ketobacteraceae bacterium]|nr:PilZ domain-containing protein [Ketobacteraceae bacterium]